MQRRPYRSDEPAGPAVRPRRFACFISLCAACVLLVSAATALADEATVAVAANFLAPLQSLEAGFESARMHDLTIVSGSTGQLYAQIVNGAPFDLLLAADRERPALLAERGGGDASSVFTYAVGRLALWSAQPGLVDATLLHHLDTADFRWLAIANPELAPYGSAAREVLLELGFWAALQPRIVRGQNIGQAFAMAQSRSADIGLIALSQAIAYQGPASYSAVAAGLHAPIRQDGIVLRHGAGNAAALAFVEYLKSAEAIEVIEGFGYLAPAADK